ncbi:hypothetical protein THER_0192 [Thermodesulfovibrio sp. N1]|nr:hypothetical protein THER_0192 [Thermodesulfovibrio sp. N1]
MKNLLVSITFSKPKEFDRLCEKKKSKKESSTSKKTKCHSEEFDISRNLKKREDS